MERLPWLRHARTSTFWFTEGSEGFAWTLASTWKRFPATGTHRGMSRGRVASGALSRIVPWVPGRGDSRKGQRNEQARAPSLPPTLEVERALLASGPTLLACVDEVGRGALSGPVTVGVVALSTGTGPPPEGLRDSKLLTPAQRLSLVPAIEEWADCAVGMATPGEIDDVGIVPALSIAAFRALLGLQSRPDHVLLDGNYDFLSSLPGQTRTVVAGYSGDVPPVTTVVKADKSCAGVAAASVIAKVSRDQYMEELSRDFQEYRWDSNKGYASSAHIAALARLGPTPFH